MISSPNRRRLGALLLIVVGVASVMIWSKTSVIPTNPADATPPRTSLSIDDQALRRAAPNTSTAASPSSPSSSPSQSLSPESMDLLKRLPKKHSTNGEEAVHAAPTSLLRAARELSELKSNFRDATGGTNPDSSSVQQQFALYSACASDESIFDSVRALCWSNLLELNSESRFEAALAGLPLPRVPEKIRLLANKLKE